MLRKVLPLIVLLVFMSSDSALGWGHRRCCRRARRSCVPCARVVPNYCLQEIYMDFPPTGPGGGVPDLYFCVTYEEGCVNDNIYYEDLWYGTPTHDLPQSCYWPGPPCESGAWGSQKRGLSKGHGQMFTAKDQACDWLNENYPGGNPHRPCHYYLVVVGSKTYHVVVMKAHSENTSGFRVRYFGAETEPLNTGMNPETPEKTITNGQVHGHALVFNYSDQLQLRRAVVWLK
jgi:hypothetical protein